MDEGEMMTCYTVRATSATVVLTAILNLISASSSLSIQLSTYKIHNQGNEGHIKLSFSHLVGSFLNRDDVRFKCECWQLTVGW